MAVECTCPKCSARYRVDDRFAGKNVRCKKCGGAIHVGGEADPDALRLRDDDAGDLPSAGSSVGRSSIAASLVAKARAGGDNPSPSPRSSFDGLPQTIVIEREVEAPASRAPSRPIYGITTPFLSDSAAGMISVVLLLAHLGLWITTLVKMNEALAGRNLDSETASKVTGLLVLTGVVHVGCFFLLYVPAYFFSAVVGSKVDRDFPGFDLIRACGVASVPNVVVLSLVLNSSFSVLDVAAAVLLGFVIGLVATLLAIRELMQLSVRATAVTFLVFIVLGGSAMWGSAQIRRKAIAWYIGEPKKPTATYASSTPRPANPTAAAPAAPVPTPPAQDPYKAQLEEMLPRLEQQLAQPQSFTREQLQTRWQLQIEHFQKLPARPESPLYVRYAEQITRIQQMIAAAPSGEAPPEVFAPLENAFALANSPADAEQLGPAMQLGPVAIQPLKSARLDLSRYTSRAGSLSWTLGATPNARLTLSLIPRRQEKQTRPWVTPNKSLLAQAEAKGLYVIEMPPPMETVVSLGGLTLLRLATPPAAAPGERRIYAGVHAGQFVELTITHDRPEDKASLDQLEAMARSLRALPEGESAGDPFAMTAIVTRLEDDFANAAPIIEAAGESAEDAVLDWAKSTGKPPTEQTVALLRKIGTRKSAAFLAGLAPAQPPPGTGGPAVPVKPAEKPIIPAATVLEKFELEIDRQKKIEMLDSLARQSPTSIREEIATLLEGILLAPGNDPLLPAAGKALAVWHGAKTIERLTPMIDKGVPSPYRQAAMTALAGTRNPKLVMPILLCMPDEPETTVAAMIAMGPVAEADVIKLLRENDPFVRRNGGRILKEIGTSRCIVPLKNATSTGDPIFTEALETVAARRRAGGK